jgi:hypothetical protein
MHKRRTANDSHSTECVLGEGRQNESRAVDVLVVIAEELLLLLWGERAQRLRKLTLGILAAHHEADLAGGVGWNGRVGVLSLVINGRWSHWFSAANGVSQLLKQVGAQRGTTGR